ncbi:DUF2945 domain-containing protein [Lentzea sp. BCCO 10_0856]|uniref:DUF2945 domain-containing protein n=1 Tax=Lentzea miocenica TaxID=3095431 RepID=A0ABU4SUD5_9PSEU|nr:DUF2945 domain-containing protein [Lentzea sp. BCCO 10_0856]MDX8029522.1 DUF2945 domain-containing protein [Lentzea sp. BCCO 10_0856]
MTKHPFKPGDEVEWSSHGSRTHGEVKEEIPEEKEAADRKVKASKDEPQYRVESAKSGRDAVHKPSALRPHRHSSSD